MIIVEGPDNSGKTTLSNRLAKDLDFEVIHSPGPLDRGVKMISWLFNEMVQQKEGVIYDRISLISDMVYANIIRSEDSFYTKRGYIQGFKELLAATPHLIIFCRPSDNTINNFGEREQMDGVIDNTNSLIAGYEARMTEYIWDNRFNVLIYNFELGEKHYQLLLKEIMYFLKNKKGATK